MFLKHIIVKKYSYREVKKVTKTILKTSWINIMNKKQKSHLNKDKDNNIKFNLDVKINVTQIYLDNDKDKFNCIFK